MPPKIVLVTEPGTGERMGRVLRNAGHAVHHLHTGATASAALERGGVDLVLVNPGCADAPAGLVSALRARTPAPIVLIVADGTVELGRMLAAGADDFLTTPCSATHLLARVAVALGQRARFTDHAITVGGIRVDPGRRRAWLDGAPLELSRREFDLLHCLARRAGEVVSRRDLATAVWPASASDVASERTRTMDVHLSWLRRKLGDTAARPRYLHTVRGVGFRLDDDAAPRPGVAGAAFA